ncbi:MAG: hypothetical protein JSU68_13075 [Phycisphaerales bacterium]|nr:MAG: hypothetical protein JSU68_13075 [Phycisphaerales bacterium]
MSEQPQAIVSKPDGEAPVPIHLTVPGTYLLHGEDILLRLPPEALVCGAKVGVRLNGGGAVRVTRISDDPWITVTQARGLACDNGLPVRF